MQLARLFQMFKGGHGGSDAPRQIDRDARFVIIYGFPTDETFDEKAYLAHNPDVALSVQFGMIESGRAHFDQFKHLYSHKMPVKGASEQVKAVRARKMEKIRDALKDEFRGLARDEGPLDVMSADQKKRFGVKATENVSSHDYDLPTVNLVNQHADGLLLDCGAGRRSIYYDNVVNYEIVAYESTDVIGVAEQLPFRDDSFDAVFSYAVLEHVKQPFAAAKELIRVLKPGGTLRVAVPFLQPLHGYPSHYFNMTQFGLLSLFEEDLDVTEQFVGPGGGPIWSMYMFLSAWHAGLPEATRGSFLDLTVRDLLVHPTHLMARDFVTQLSESAMFEIASATGLVGRKK